jgi:hypothetical protein
MSKHVKDVIQSVNQHSTADECKQFVEFISGNPLDGNCIKFLSELKLFQERKSGKYVSTNQVSPIVAVHSLQLENRHTCVYLCGQQLLLVTFVKLLYSAAAGRYIICHLIHQVVPRKKIW